MNHKLFDLQARVIVITGGSSGLGLEFARVLAGAGASLVITSRNLEKATLACAQMENCDTLPLELDQTSYPSVEAMIEKASGWKGRIDVLINNAGGGSGGTEGCLWLREPQHIEQMIATNLTGTIFCCKAVAPILIRQKSGKIINIASIAGIVGRDRQMYERNSKMQQPVDYAAAKGGVIALTRDLAACLGPHGVQVNSLSPGGFDKGELPKGFVDDFAKETMLGHMGRPTSDLDGAILFLASSASDYITGHNLVVDGGFTVMK